MVMFMRIAVLALYFSVLFFKKYHLCTLLLSYYHLCLMDWSQCISPRKGLYSRIIFFYVPFFIYTSRARGACPIQLTARGSVPLFHTTATTLTNSIDDPKYLVSYFSHNTNCDICLEVNTLSLTGLQNSYDVATKIQIPNCNYSNYIRLMINNSNETWTQHM